MRFFMLGVLTIGLVFLLLVQPVPYGRAHTDSSVGQQPPWDSDRTRILFARG